MIPIVSVVGTSDAGKTTLLEKLIAEFKTRGIRAAVVKHDVHGFDIDKKGKDSWRLKQAGATAVVISSPYKVAVIEDVDHDHTLSQLRDRLNLQVDIILSEGYKRDQFPKVEVFRKGHRDHLLCTEPEDNLILVASDVDLEGLFEIEVPRLDLNDSVGIVDFLEARFLRK